MLYPNKGETFKQYQVRANNEIERLQALAFCYIKQVKEMQESTNTVHIDELKKRDDRILKLVNRLKDLGLYCGE